MKDPAVRPLSRFAMVALGICLGAGAGNAAPDTKGGIGIVKPTLFEVGYSHLDTQWCWTYPQVIGEFIPNTLHENFALFEKYPDYVFNWTGSNRYRFMKEYYPDDYATLKKYIAAGRWFPAGSSVEEGDVNSPSEESLIRQVMYGNEFFRREFGMASDEFMLPDCFGFPASLPSILAHCGLKGFSTQKLTWGSAVGIPFEVGNWVGPDGRSVVAALDAGSYTSNINDDLSNDRRAIARVDKEDALSGVPVDYRYYGVGDRGGAPRESAVKNLELSLHGSGPLTVVGGRADAMFDDLSPDEIAKLPSYRGDLELTQHSAGSITSEAEMKRWNRKNEILADATEKASVAADWLGVLPYDRSRITDAWLRFLPGQFHDLMAGTALPLAYNYTWNDEILAMNEFAGVLQSAVGGVARELNTNVGGVPIVVYNPLSIARQDVVEAWVHLPPGAKAVRVLGPGGVAAPAQVDGVKDGKSHVVFLATVGSLGYSTYGIRPAVTSGRSELKVTRRRLENGRYRVQIDANGDVSSIFDKLYRKELLKGPARLAFLHENPSAYPAWNMDWSDQQKPPRAYVTGAPTVKITESGPARVAVQVTRKSEGSVFTQTIRLASGSAGDRVEFANRIDWQGREEVLKAVFPLTVSNPQATYNWELGTIKRGNDDPKKYEVASHRWIDLTDSSGAYGVSILDDSKYGSDKPDDNTMRLSLLYTPGTRGGYQHQGTQDIGRHEILYAVDGHRGTGLLNTQWDAARLNQPLIAFEAPKHPGPLGSQFSLATVSDRSIQIEALKRAEDTNEIIVRINELSGLPQRNVRIGFAAPVVSAREVDGQERAVGPAVVSGGDLVFDTTAYHPRAFAIRLAKPNARPPAVIAKPLPLPYNAIVASTWAKKTDGNFDGAGRSLPGELLPRTIVSDDVTFKLAPAGVKDAVIPHGQVITLPVGRNRRVYFLAAAARGDTKAIFKLGGRKIPLSIQAWDGFIGQWDSRLWSGKVPELTYSWDNPLAGLVPGFIKRDPVAWYADHRRLADGTNDIYAFAYLYRYSIQVPDTATSLTLPTNETVRILAATEETNPNDDTRPAEPLYDVLDRTGVAGPTISPSGGSYSDSIAVRVSQPLYWSNRQVLRYTTDGSVPTKASPAYSGHLVIDRKTHLRVAQVSADGSLGPIAQAEFNVNDTTPPSLTSATGMAATHLVQLSFSEPVDPASATDAKHYSLQPRIAVLSAKVSRDARTVMLELGRPLEKGTAYTVAADGVTDLSPAANPSKSSLPLSQVTPVFSSPEIDDFDGSQRGLTANDETGLPTKGDAPWTINMFVYFDEAPGELTLIGGFGDGRDSNGAERYLCNYHRSIHFWGSNIDVFAGQPYDVGKWQMITASYDGQSIRLYKNGLLLKEEEIKLADAQPMVRLATRGPWPGAPRFAGKVAGFTIWRAALPAEYIATLKSGMPVR